jgi:hypothetical protein
MSESDMCTLHFGPTTLYLKQNLHSSNALRPLSTRQHQPLVEVEQEEGPAATATGGGLPSGQQRSPQQPNFANLGLVVW